MQIILITGETGIGKSRLLTDVATHHKMVVVDPLAEGKNTWIEPPKSSRGVVIAHLSYLQDANVAVSAATAWCKEHAGRLWLCDVWRLHVEEAGIALPSDAIELHLERNIWPWPVTARPGKRIVSSFDQALSIAHRLAS
ncbi:hypothetical protein [Burkholderia sp. LMG 32019]|uniref:hypothetical protein n=1 Tax=Burkholderia sp. LMG 32019 TaxID=3158173 RepID=UPI003C2FE8D4